MKTSSPVRSITPPAAEPAIKYSNSVWSSRVGFTDEEYERAMVVTNLTGLSVVKRDVDSADCIIWEDDGAVRFIVLVIAVVVDVNGDVAFLVDVTGGVVFLVVGVNGDVVFLVVDANGDVVFLVVGVIWDVIFLIGVIGDVGFLVVGVIGDVVFLVVGVNRDVVFLVVDVNGVVVFLVGDVVYDLRVVVPDGISHNTLTSPPLPPFCWNHKHWWKVPDEDDGEYLACTSIDWYCNSSNLSDVSCGSGQPIIRLPFTTTCVEHDDILISCDVTSRSPRKYDVTVHRHGRLILEKSM